MQSGQSPSSECDSAHLRSDLQILFHRDAYKKKEGMSQDDAKVAYAAKLKEVCSLCLLDTEVEAEPALASYTRFSRPATLTNPRLT